MTPEARAAPELGAARLDPPPPGEVALSAGERVRANLLGVPIAFAAIGLCAALGLLIRSAVFAA